MTAEIYLSQSQNQMLSRHAISAVSTCQKGVGAHDNSPLVRSQVLGESNGACQPLFHKWLIVPSNGITGGTAVGCTGRPLLMTAAIICTFIPDRAAAATTRLMRAINLL